MGFKKEIELMKNEYLSKTKNNKIFQQIKQFIKCKLPQNFLNLVRKIRFDDYKYFEKDFYHYGGNRWTIRCFARLK